MKAIASSDIKRQLYWPKEASAHNTDVIRSMGVESPESTSTRQGRDWTRHQVCRQDTFSLVVLESFHAGTDIVGYTRQEEYLKINFWLGGRHTTVLDGLGQCEHQAPEIFLTSAPPGVIKMDMLNRDSHISCVALCLLPEFFPMHMGMELDELPDPLRAIVFPQERPYALQRLSLTNDIAIAARAILAAPFEARRHPLYAPAKAVELMCLMLAQLQMQSGKTGRSRLNPRHEQRLHSVRELLTQRFAEPMTLPRICKEVGLNRESLTTGFKQLFGTSVNEYLRKVRMEQAYQMLLEEANSVDRVAEAVGYAHSCNFSTAFHEYYGFSPKAVGSRGPRSAPRRARSV